MATQVERRASEGAPVGQETSETVWSLFEEQAREQPEQAAVVDGEVEIDYRRLARRAEAIARTLDVEPGSRVGVCMDRTWELPATLLGILRAGCAYVPLDPAYPRERVGYMIEHAGLAAAVVDGPKNAERCGKVPKLLRLDELPDSTDDPEAGIGGASPEDLAYVLYTSGSTGRPKGVAVEHRHVAAFVHAMGTLLDAEELSGMAAVASICFDASVMEILGTLCLGGTVILAENALHLPELPAVDRVRACVMVPSAMKALLAAGELPAGIRCVVLGAEMLTRPLVDRIQAQPSAPRVINVYGPTEDTVYSTTAEIAPGTGAVPIGKPVPGTRTYVLDENLRPASQGELYLAGDQLARGYLNDEERTRERFLTVEPSDAVPESRLYRTGDLCRVGDDGELELLGRLDQQVKIRGRRIELEEIEATLESMEGVAAAAAAAVDGTDGEKTLVGYAVVDGPTVTGEAMRAFLSERLPDYMVPRVVMLLDELPRLPNDKLDRKRLPRPTTCRPAGGDGPAPGIPLERDELLSAVRRQAAAVLHLQDAENISPEDLLDDLGLDSLSKVELGARLGAVVGRKLSAAALLKTPTVASVVDHLLAADGASSERTPETPNADTLRSFQTQIQGCYPPFLAGKAPAWSAADRGVFVRELKELVSRPGDPFCKLVRTGSGHRGVVADVDTDRVREALIWTTNLYLGLNRDPEVIAAAREALDRFGTGMGTSAAASGITDLHVAFEQGFAELVGMESACLFPTGYTANMGAVAGLLGSRDVVVMDQLCHASIVDGARLSGAKIRTFRHNSPADLKAVLASEASPYRTILVIIEGVYSMGEGAAPVSEIARTAKEYGALVLVDEAHSFGFYGPRGAGICAEQGATDQVDFIMTTLSKALGSLGGVVAASKDHVALLKSSSRAFIFQASTSPADIAAALAALGRLREDDRLRERLWDTTAYMRKRFSEAGYDLGTGDGPIVTPHFYDKEKLFAVVNGLFERGIHTSAVTYPIVESGRGRLRFICSAAHSRADVDRTLEALIEADREAEARRSETDANAENGASPERTELEDWVERFGTHLREKTVRVPGRTPELAVVVGIPDDGEPITVFFNENDVTVSAGRPEGTISCSLLMTNRRSASALCASDVQGLLESMLDGTCVLNGSVEVFVWFLGRLKEHRDAAVVGEGEDTAAER